MYLQQQIIEATLPSLHPTKIISNPYSKDYLLVSSYKLKGIPIKKQFKNNFNYCFRYLKWGVSQIQQISQNQEVQTFLANEISQIIDCVAFKPHVYIFWCKLVNKKLISIPENGDNKLQKNVKRQALYFMQIYQNQNCKQMKIVGCYDFKDKLYQTHLKLEKEWKQTKVKPIILESMSLQKKYIQNSIDNEKIILSILTEHIFQGSGKQYITFHIVSGLQNIYLSSINQLEIEQKSTKNPKNNPQQITQTIQETRQQNSISHYYIDYPLYQSDKNHRIILDYQQIYEPLGQNNPHGHKIKYKLLPLKQQIVQNNEQININNKSVITDYELKLGEDDCLQQFVFKMFSMPYNPKIEADLEFKSSINPDPILIAVTKFHARYRIIFFNQVPNAKQVKWFADFCVQPSVNLIETSLIKGCKNNVLLVMACQNVFNFQTEIIIHHLNVSDNKVQGNQPLKLCFKQTGWMFKSLSGQYTTKKGYHITMIKQKAIQQPLGAVHKKQGTIMKIVQIGLTDKNVLYMKMMKNIIQDNADSIEIIGEDMLDLLV